MGHTKLFTPLLLVLVAGMAIAAPSHGASSLITPGPDWCEAANAIAPGDELHLAAGDYRGPCTLRVGGSPGAPIVIRADDPGARPQLQFSGSIGSVITVAASFVTIRGVRFGPTLPGVDGIRLAASEDVTIEDCEFEDMGGIAVVSAATTRGLTIRNNQIVRSNATAIYLGCRDGAACRATNAIVAGNSIEGVAARVPDVGYGVQVELNSTALVRANVITNTNGPGIMISGARDLGLMSLVERNLVTNSRTAAGIVLRGGPVVVQNNIVVGGADAGIALETWGGRRLLRGVVVANNTVYAAVGGGISVPDGGRTDAKLLYNAAHTFAGPAFPPPRPGLFALGNVDCRATPCFVDPLARNFAPSPGSPLVGRARRGAGMPADDFFGISRPLAGAAGAVEAGAERPASLDRN